MADLIDRAALIMLFCDRPDYSFSMFKRIRRRIESAPAVDAVEVDALKAWLYEIAMNNTNNYLGDACEEIISRLDGLRAFARERRSNAKMRRSER